MPRLTDTVPKYRKHKGTGQAVVTINGRDYYLGPHGTRASHLEYDRLISEWLASGRSIAYGAAKASLTITELIVAYMDHARTYYGDHSRSEYANMRYALRPLRELYSLQLAHEFGPMKLKAVSEKFIAAGNCRTYINRRVRRISHVFRWGAGEGHIRRNPALIDRQAYRTASTLQLFRMGLLLTIVLTTRRFTSARQRLLPPKSCKRRSENIGTNHPRKSSAWYHYFREREPI